jgi:hypothetical protein
MSRVSQSMSAIDEASSQIGKIIKIIEEIAFQTNLLALNAAVEAARAGEQGKGFSVVAEEVRRLAQRSAQAARDTTELIENCVARTNEGTQVASSAAQVLTEVGGGANAVADLLKGISVNAAEQARGVEEIRDATARVDQVTQGNATCAKESASAAEELTCMAVSLKSQVAADLVALVEGESRGARRRMFVKRTQVEYTENDRVVRVPANTLDISATGVGLQSRKPLAPRTSCTIKVEDSFGETRLLKGRISRCQAGSSGNATVGVQFTSGPNPSGR